MKKWISIIIYAVIVLSFVLTKDTLLFTIHSGNDLAIYISIFFFSLLVFFPIVPFIVATGIVGSLFGVVTGTLIIFTGVMTGTMTMFFMARYGFRDFMRNFLNKYEKAKHYDTLFQEHAFITILGVRIFPILPSPVVNIMCGSTNVNWVMFTIATSFGILPRIIIFTLAGYQTTESITGSLLLYGAYFLIVTIVIYNKVKRKPSAVRT
ncbi:TVP38/TMEM64 family protein [Salirhabdus salicampi]|uniref:TVP38/TMEM64 family protein n=1 Tax=Salirhabdus salicampi TaxID=476102 RepID=UPI0020C5277B|nr:TVP38/TMEM64 family protein [Salirhabdus salicampi]MCP8615767.1 TVP38/TMEM64 family protein [Salirhabdus salicampi]